MKVSTAEPDIENVTVLWFSYYVASGSLPGAIFRFGPDFAKMSRPNHELASALRRGADLLIERSANPEICEEAPRCWRQDAIADGAMFASFSESPYSGCSNALAPTHVEYRRDGDAIVATVRLETALEGGHDRAHGGATAAVFDDAIDALQQVIERIRYTRTLGVSYFAPFPTDKDVRIVAECRGSTDGLFFVEATTTDGVGTLAKSSGVFTEVTPDIFGLA